MKETVLITGAHGLMARHLAPELEAYFNVKLLSTGPDGPAMYKWDVEAGYVDPEALKDVDHIVHLAGARFYDGNPLTEERKALSRNSRAGAALLLLKQLKDGGQVIKSFISASTAAYYDFEGPARLIGEDGTRAGNFNADLCREWEEAADELKRQNVAHRVVKLRISAVLARDGGLLQRLVYNASSLPDSQRSESYMPWLHIDDMTALFMETLTNGSYDGVYNAVADEPVTLTGLIEKMTAILENRPAPDLSYTGTRITAGKLKAAGFKFRYERLDKALANLLAI